MLLLLSSGVGLFLKFTNLGHDAEVHILRIVAQHCSPSLEQQIRAILEQFENQSMIGGPFGLTSAALAAIGVFYQFERAFDRIWRIPPPKQHNALRLASSLVRKRFFAFLMLCGVGTSIIAIMIANVAISIMLDWITSMPWAGTIAIVLVDALATLLLNTLAFGVLYRTLPKRTVRWRDAFRSGLLVAIIWEFGREFLLSMLIGMRYTTMYGAVGSFIALLLWFYWGVTLLFFGAEYLQVINYRHQQPYRMFTNSARADRLRRGRYHAQRVAPTTRRAA